MPQGLRGALKLIALLREISSRLSTGSTAAAA
jgi:hypothetical protein